MNTFTLLHLLFTVECLHFKTVHYQVPNKNWRKKIGFSKQQRKEKKDFKGIFIDVVIATVKDFLFFGNLKNKN
jgi:hypothetical protein